MSAQPSKLLIMSQRLYGLLAVHHATKSILGQYHGIVAGRLPLVLKYAMQSSGGYRILAMSLVGSLEHYTILRTSSPGSNSFSIVVR